MPSVETFRQPNNTLSTQPRALGASELDAEGHEAAGGDAIKGRNDREIPLTGLHCRRSLALAASAASADDASANLRLMAFGGDAQLTAVKHAVARFNQKYPNVKVEIAIDPITNGWGDYVTHVLSQFNANNAYDVYGTAIETFRTFETRGLFIPLDDYIARNASYSDFDPSLFKYSSYKGKTYFIPIGWNNIMINYNREAIQGGRG